jgi:hypothetical protein
VQPDSSHSLQWSEMVAGLRQTHLTARSGNACCDLYRVVCWQYTGHPPIPYGLTKHVTTPMPGKVGPIGYPKACVMSADILLTRSNISSALGRAEELVRLGSMQLYANNSYYQGLHLLSGLSFGAFEYSFMIRPGVFIDVLLFFFLTFAPLAYLLMRKYQIIVYGEEPFLPSRSYIHIMMDFLFAISVSATFSIIVYIYNQKYSILGENGAVSLHSFILILNLLGVGIAMLVLRSIAVKERIDVLAARRKPQKSSNDEP